MLTPGDLGGLPSHIPTLPSLLGERNYSSLLLGKTKIDLKLMAMHVFGKIYGELFPGKWHLGVGAEGESLPTRRGFQQYLGVGLFHISYKAISIMILVIGIAI